MSNDCLHFAFTADGHEESIDSTHVKMAYDADIHINSDRSTIIKMYTGTSAGHDSNTNSNTNPVPIGSLSHDPAMGCALDTFWWMHINGGQREFNVDADTVRDVSTDADMKMAPLWTENSVSDSTAYASDVSSYKLEDHTSVPLQSDVKHGSSLHSQRDVKTETNTCTYSYAHISSNTIIAADGTDKHTCVSSDVLQPTGTKRRRLDRVSKQKSGYCTFAKRSDSSATTDTGSTDESDGEQDTRYSTCSNSSSSPPLSIASRSRPFLRGSSSPTTIPRVMSSGSTSSCSSASPSKSSTSGGCRDTVSAMKHREYDKQRRTKFKYAMECLYDEIRDMQILEDDGKQMTTAEILSESALCIKQLREQLDQLNRSIMKTQHCDTSLQDEEKEQNQVKGETQHTYSDLSTSSSHFSFTPLLMPVQLPHLPTTQNITSPSHRVRASPLGFLIMETETETEEGDISDTTSTCTHTSDSASIHASTHRSASITSSTHSHSPSPSPNPNQSTTGTGSTISSSGNSNMHEIQLQGQDPFSDAIQLHLHIQHVIQCK